MKEYIQYYPKWDYNLFIFGIYIILGWCLLVFLYSLVNNKENESN